MFAGFVSLSWLATCRFHASIGDTICVSVCAYECVCLLECLCSVVELRYRKAVRSDSGAAYILRQLETYYKCYDEIGTGENMFTCPLCSYGELCEGCYLTTVRITVM